MHAIAEIRRFASSLTRIVLLTPEVYKSFLAGSVTWGDAGAVADDVRKRLLQTTSGTHARASSSPITEVAAQLGHKDPSITLKV